MPSTVTVVPHKLVAIGNRSPRHTPDPRFLPKRATISSSATAGENPGKNGVRVGVPGVTVPSRISRAQG